MTVLDIVLVLRERLEMAYKHNRQSDADELFVIFDRLVEISYESHNQDMTGLLVNLRDTAHDIVAGASGKSHVPTVENVLTAFAVSAEPQ
jgi:hypothetical protein